MEKSNCFSGFITELDHFFISQKSVLLPGNKFVNSIASFQVIEQSRSGMLFMLFSQ